MHGTVLLPVPERLCCAEYRVPDWWGVVKIIQFAHTRPEEEEDWKDEEEDDLDESVEAGPSPTKSVSQLNLDLMSAFRDAKSSGFVIDSRKQDERQPVHQGVSPCISRGSPHSPSFTRSLDNDTCMLSIFVTLGCARSLPCSRALLFLFLSSRPPHENHLHATPDLENTNPPLEMVSHQFVREPPTCREHAHPQLGDRSRDMKFRTYSRQQHLARLLGSLGSDDAKEENDLGNRSLSVNVLNVCG